MNSILLCFLCGAAFLGGGVATVWMVSIAVKIKKPDTINEDLRHYWLESIKIHREQVAATERIATMLECKLK